MSPRTIVKPIVIETPVTTPDPAVIPAAVTTDPAVPTVAIPVTGVGVDSWLVDFARVPSITIGVDPASMTCIFGKEAKSTNETKRNHILWVLLALTSAPTSARGLEYRKWVASNEASLQANYGKYFVHIDYHAFVQTMRWHETHAQYLDVSP